MSFKQVVDSFGPFMTFEPKYKFKDLALDFDDEFLQEHCYAKGAYCAISDIYIESKSELDEAIRQKCIWQLSNTDKTLKDIWWDYAVSYRTCLKDKLKGSNVKVIDCYPKISNKLKFKQATLDAIEKCYNDSFALPGDKYESPNSILKQDVNSAEYMGVYLVPALFINNNLVKEDLRLHLAVSAICDQLVDKPDFCQDFLMANINWSFPEKKSYRNSIIIIVSLVLMGVIIIFLMVAYVKRKMNRNIDEEIESQIKNHVSEYMRLRDSQDESRI